MPIVVCLKNGLQLVIHGDKIDSGEWKPKARLMKKAMNGHEILIAASEVVMLETVPFTEYEKRVEDMKNKKEMTGDEKSGSIVRPAMMVPRRH